MDVMVLYRYLRTLIICGGKNQLKRLNLRKPKEYDYGMDTETVKPRIRFYCIAEGATEESYLEGVKTTKTFLK